MFRFHVKARMFVNMWSLLWQSNMIIAWLLPSKVMVWGTRKQHLEERFTHLSLFCMHFTVYSNIDVLYYDSKPRLATTYIYIYIYIRGRGIHCWTFLGKNAGKTLNIYVSEATWAKTVEKMHTLDLIKGSPPRLAKKLSEQASRGLFWACLELGLEN